MLATNAMSQIQEYHHQVTRRDLLVSAINELLNEGEQVANNLLTAKTHGEGTIIAGMQVQLTVVKIGNVYNWFVGKGFTPMARKDVGVVIFEILWNC